MQEHRQEQIARYVAEYTGSYNVKSLTTWITHGVGYFDALGVMWPNDTDYQGLKAEMLGTLPGVKKGTFISSGQADKRVAETRKFYEWLKQQEGETQQMNFEGTAQQAEFELEGAEALQQGNIEPVSREGVAECADAGASVQEITTEEEDSGSPSVATVEPVDESPADDTPAQPKRGRKPKAAAEKRTVKLSIYLTPSLYSALDDLAHYDQREISDVIYGLVEDFTERNAEQLLDYRSFLARRKAIR